MTQKIAHVTLVVKNYDEAIDFYVNKLRFKLIEDTKLSETKRWVLVAPKGNGSCNLLLAQADGRQQLQFVGNQTGGRVFLFLHTDNFDSDYENLQKHAIKIVDGPRSEAYGKVLVFEDLYGNRWDLIEPK
ncbi:MAG: VOC family protein [Flavobacteriaceae bacterium]|nr:VOC family protein [Flavobacteriaceae bacterium]